MNVPFCINLSVTDRCNFRCSHCKIPERNSKELTKEEIFSLVDDLNRLGTRKISLCGGEPLLRKDIGEIIDYIKSNYKTILVTLITNGALVKDKINELKNLDLLMVSFDGSPKAQEKVRGVQAYDIGIGAIETARKHNLKVWTATTFTKNNLQELPTILDLAEHIGFCCIFLPVYQYAMSGKSVTNLFPDKEEFRDTIEKLEKFKKGPKGYIVKNSKASLGYLKKWPNFKKLSCWAGRSYAYIDTDGRIYPCIQMVQKTKGVSLLEMGADKAIKKLTRLTCPGCWCISNIELNYLFSLSPETCFHFYNEAQTVYK